MARPRSDPRAHAAMGERFPDDRVDSRVRRMADPSGNPRANALTLCDGCDFYRDYHYVLYNTDRNARSLLHCSRCYAGAHDMSVQQAERIFRKRVGRNRIERVEEYTRPSMAKRSPRISAASRPTPPQAPPKS